MYTARETWKSKKKKKKAENFFLGKEGEIKNVKYSLNVIELLSIRFSAFTFSVPSSHIFLFFIYFVIFDIKIKLKKNIETDRTSQINPARRGWTDDFLISKKKKELKNARDM